MAQYGSIRQSGRLESKILEARMTSKHTGFIPRLSSFFEELPGVGNSLAEMAPLLWMKHHCNFSSSPHPLYQQMSLFVMLLSSTSVCGLNFLAHGEATELPASGTCTASVWSIKVAPEMFTNVSAFRGSCCIVMCCAWAPRELHAASCKKTSRNVWMKQNILAKAAEKMMAYNATPTQVSQVRSAV